MAREFWQFPPLMTMESSVKGRRRQQVLAVFVVSLALCGAGHAAYFKMETEIGPEEATESPGSSTSCTPESTTNAAASISDSSQQVRVFVATSSTVDGTDCTAQAATASAAAAAAGTIESDTGETGPVTICVGTSASQRVSSSGTGYNAGSALVLESVILSIGTVYEYLGPTILTEGSDSDVQRFEVEAMIGDTVQALAVAQTDALGGPGEGAASASNRGELILSIGPCSATMAPVASPKVMVGLIIALGLLGATSATKSRTV